MRKYKFNSVLYYEYQALTFQDLLLCHKVQTSAFYRSSRPLCYMKSPLILGSQLYVVNKVHHEGFYGHTFQSHPVNLLGWNCNIYRRRKACALVSFTSSNYIALLLVFFFLKFLTTCYENHLWWNWIIIRPIGTIDDQVYT